MLERTLKLIWYPLLLESLNKTKKFTQGHKLVVANMGWLLR